jgi:hypothetical protein
MKGRLVESTVREGEGMANMWDYNFALPLTDKKSKQKRNLPEGNYLTRCSNCRGKCFVTCTNYECRGDGRVQYEKQSLFDRSHNNSYSFFIGIVHNIALNVVVQAKYAVLVVRV